MNAHDSPDNRKALSQLPAGTPMFLELNGVTGRAQSILIGLCPKRFVLVTAPKPPDGQAQQIYPILYAGNGVTCYTMLPGTAAAFKSHIIRFVVTPFPMLFLSYPANVQLANIRQHARVRCLFEAVLKAGQFDVKGMITDLSFGGCGFVFAADGASPYIDVDMDVDIANLQLASSNDQSVKARVRSSQKRANLERLGLQFDTVPDGMLDELHRFITEAVKLGQA
jgi:c-di-GMP-binding flagellar brake protein YcgR